MAKIKRGTTLQASVPDPQIAPAKPLPAPKVPPRAPFLLKVHPERWTVLAGRLVPSVGYIHGTPGCNGVDRDRAGNPVFGAAIADAEDKGWKVIPRDIDGHGTDYLRLWPHGGYTSRWTELYPGSTHEGFDEAGFAEWLESLMERGIIEGPPAYIVENMLQTLQKSVDGFRSRNLPKDAARIKRMEDQIKVLTQAMAA